MNNEVFFRNRFILSEMKIFFFKTNLNAVHALVDLSTSK